MFEDSAARRSAPLAAAAGHDPVAPEAMATVIDPPSAPVEQADFEMKTREMAAVDLEALGLEARLSNPGLPVSSSRSTISVIVEDQTNAKPASVPRAPVLPTGSGVGPPAPRTTGARPSPSVAAAEADVDVDVSIDTTAMEAATASEEELETTTISAVPEPPPPPPLPPPPSSPALPTSAQAAPVAPTPASTAVVSPPPVPTVAAASPPTPPQQRPKSSSTPVRERLKTMALTEDDLEEVMEAARASTRPATSRTTTPALAPATTPTPTPTPTDDAAPPSKPGGKTEPLSALDVEVADAAPVERGSGEIDIEVDGSESAPVVVIDEASDRSQRPSVPPPIAPRASPPPRAGTAPLVPAPERLAKRGDDVGGASRVRHAEDAAAAATGRGRRRPPPPPPPPATEHRRHAPPTPPPPTKKVTTTPQQAVAAAASARHATRAASRGSSIYSTRTTCARCRS